MAYCTQTDVQHAAGGAAKLLNLADHDGDGAIDAAVITDAIAAADEWINSYAQKRYTVPFSPVPDIVKRFSAAEAVYQLKIQRRATDDDDRERHDERREWLEGVASGAISPGVDPPSTKSSTVRPAAVSSRESLSTDQISRDRLKGPW